MSKEIPTISQVWSAPPMEGRIVSVVRHRDHVIIATERSLYKLVNIDGQSQAVALHVDGLYRISEVGVER